MSDETGEQNKVGWLSKLLRRTKPSENPPQVVQQEQQTTSYRTLTPDEAADRTLDAIRRGGAKENPIQPTKQALQPNMHPPQMSTMGQGEPASRAKAPIGSGLQTSQDLYAIGQAKRET